jgi:hypothetical protein
MVILIAKSEKQLHRMCETYGNKDVKKILELLTRGPLPPKIFASHQRQKQVKTLNKLAKLQLIEDISTETTGELYVADFSLVPSSAVGNNEKIVDKLSNRISDELEDFLNKEGTKIKAAYEKNRAGITLGRFIESIFAEAFEKTFNLLHKETVEEDKRIAYEMSRTSNK